MAVFRPIKNISKPDFIPDMHAGIKEFFDHIFKFCHNFLSIRKYKFNRLKSNEFIVQRLVGK